MILPLLITLALSDSATDWRWQVLSSGSQASLRGIDVVDARTAWASGSGGVVLRTVDGQTWERCPVPGAEELDFRDVEAFDGETALIVSAGTPARVYRTEDGGAHWTLTLEHSDKRAFFDAFDFWDDRRGLLFSDPIDGRAVVFATDDGGKSWSALSPESIPALREGEAGFAASGTCLVTAPGGRAWIGLGGARPARVLRTLDGGKSWDVFETPLGLGSPGSGIFSLVALDADRLVAVGGDYQVPDGTAASAAWSSDGGASWSAPEHAPSGYRSGVAVLDADTTVTVGPNGCDVSFDGGKSWARFSDEGFHAIATSADGSVVASGADGRLARLVRGGATAAWDRYRGPNGIGIAEGEGYPDRVGPEAEVLWKRPFPPGYSSPVLSSEHLFLTGVEEERLFTYALARDTGRTVWRREAPRPRRTVLHAKNHPAAASAAVDGDTIVVFFDEYGMLAYDHAGAERWRFPLGPFDNAYGMGASPILVGELAILACDQGTNSYLLAVDKNTGAERWRVPRPQAISGHCTPILYAAEDGRVELILPGSFLLDAYDALTGERRWWVRGLPSEMKSVPVLIGDVLWIHGYASPLNDPGKQIEVGAMSEMDTNGDGRVVPEEVNSPTVRRYFRFFDLDQDGAFDAEEWEVLCANLAAKNSAMAIRVGGRGDRTDEAVLWSYHRAIPQLPSPLVYHGVYYLLADQGGLVTTLDPDTGERMEHGRLVDAVDAYFTAPVAADGRIYMLGESGVLSVLAAGGSLEPIYTSHFDEACFATPTLEDGRVYLRTNETLFAFGK